MLHASHFRLCILGLIITSWAVQGQLIFQSWHYPIPPFPDVSPDMFQESVSFKLTAKGQFPTHPSLERWCRKKSLAANLIAFSGVTRVRFTAAPREKGHWIMRIKELLTGSFRNVSQLLHKTKDRWRKAGSVPKGFRNTKHHQKLTVFLPPNTLGLWKHPQMCFYSICHMCL